MLRDTNTSTRKSVAVVELPKGSTPSSAQLFAYSGLCSWYKGFFWVYLFLAVPWVIQGPPLQWNFWLKIHLFLLLAVRSLSIQVWVLTQYHYHIVLTANPQNNHRVIYGRWCDLYDNWHPWLFETFFANYLQILVSNINQHKMTANKVFDAWVDAEKRYIGTPPILDCKIYPEFCPPENLANSKSQDPSRYFLVATHWWFWKLRCYIFVCSPSWTGYWCLIFEHYHFAFFNLVFCEGLQGAIVSALSICNNFFVSRSLTLTGAMPMLPFLWAFKSFINFWIKLMYLWEPISSKSLYKMVLSIRMHRSASELLLSLKVWQISMWLWLQIFLKSPLNSEPWSVQFLNGNLPGSLVSILQKAPFTVLEDFDLIS